MLRRASPREADSARTLYEIPHLDRDGLDDLTRALALLKHRALDLGLHGAERRDARLYRSGGLRRLARTVFARSETPIEAIYPP